MAPFEQPAVAPRPLHDQEATIRALVRQMLMDLDRDAINTSVPTATLELLLTTLCDVLATKNEARMPVPLRNMMTEANNAADLIQGKLSLATEVTNLANTDDNPNVRYWRARAEADAERIGVDPPDDVP